MPKTLSGSLFAQDKGRFEQLRKEVVGFNSNYNGSNIVQDDIFHVIENYIKQQQWDFELLRYPIQDRELCACTFLREGHVFVMLNAKIPLSKQIFAAAHELYHIYRYFEDENNALADHGSILTSDILDEAAVVQEDLEANAFAGLFLAPDSALREQIRIYKINKGDITITDILVLVDIFAIPYKAMVIRLYEEELIEKERAIALLETPAEEIEKLIQLTGRSKRWSSIPVDCNSYGSLLENIAVNEKYEVLTDSRLLSDRERIQEIMATFDGE